MSRESRWNRMSSCNEKNGIIRHYLTTCKKTPFSGFKNVKSCRLNSNWYKKSKLFIFFVIFNNIFQFFTSKIWFYDIKFNQNFSFFQLSYNFSGFSWNHGQFQTSFTETVHGFKKLSQFHWNWALFFVPFWHKIG